MNCAFSVANVRVPSFKIAGTDMIAAIRYFGGCNSYSVVLCVLSTSVLRYCVVPFSRVQINDLSELVTQISFLDQYVCESLI